MIERIMYKEELYEEGIVKEAYHGIATIVISNSDQCEECTAKVYCKPGSANERSLTAKDPFGVKMGDKVRVSIRGNQILKVSFLVYGIPLLLILAGLFVGMQFFQSNKEILSSLSALILVSIYISIILLIDKKRKHETRTYPEIIFVSSRKSDKQIDFKTN
jgi:sigma-E factor negative regulatory protein RseC